MTNTCLAKLPPISCMLSGTVVSDSLQFRALQPSRLLCPWHSPGKNIGVGCHSLLQGILLTQGSKQRLRHCGQILYHVSHQSREVKTFTLFPKEETKVSNNNIFGLLLIMSMFLKKILELYTVTGREGLGLGFLRQEEGWKREFTLRDHLSTALRARSRS